MWTPVKIRCKCAQKALFQFKSYFVFLMCFSDSTYLRYMICSSFSLFRSFVTLKKGSLRIKNVLSGDSKIPTSTKLDLGKFLKNKTQLKFVIYLRGTGTRTSIGTSIFLWWTFCTLTGEKHTMNLKLRSITVYICIRFII